MKKLLALCMTMGLCLCCLASCNFLKHEHISGPWEYDEAQHWRSITCTWNKCDFNIAPENHYDNDKDDVCDACGYNMLNQAPTNYFLRNQFGVEWLNELTAENITKVKIIDQAVGVAPGVIKSVTSTTDKNAIARIFDCYYWVDTWPISKEEGKMDGGGAVTVIFILNNGNKKEIYINNGNYRDTNGNYFDLLNTPKFNDTDNVTKAFGFITYVGMGTVYNKDNNPVCEIPIDEFEFVESDGCVDAVVTGYYYTIETEFGTLWFDYSNDLFYLQFNDGTDDYRQYYRLVGKNLDKLIAEYGAPGE